MSEGTPMGFSILKDAREILPEITVSEWKPNHAEVATIETGVDGDKQDSISDSAAVAAQQIEYWFGEDSLPHDAHLLGLIGEGNGLVSFNDICHWKKIRHLAKNPVKPAIRQLLEKSEIVEMVKIGTKFRIRRKVPLQTTPTVQPKINRSEGDKPAKTVTADQPHLTKGMLKPTGFEVNGDAEVTLEEQEQDEVDYPANEAFTQRIQTAITRFRSRKKWHQSYHQVFDKFLTFGGFRGGQAQFIGGLDGKDEEECTAREKTERTQRYDITDSVLDGLEGKDNEEPTWVVDFAGIARAFFSSHFTEKFAWYDEEVVKLATNVARNFYRYLLVHKVFPEYESQVDAAITVCDVAEMELPKLAMVDKHLPGGFNVACSMIFDGHHSDQLAQGDWAQGTEGGSWNAEEAWTVIKTSIFAYGTKDQIAAIQDDKNDKTKFGLAAEVESGFEIVEVVMPTKNAQTIYDLTSAKYEIIKPMGTLRCKLWKVPNAPDLDLPDSVAEARKRQETDHVYEFLLEASTLQFCYPGCKFTATIKYFTNGLTWIDYHEATYASFFMWTANEVIKQWKEPGPPKDWMARKNEKREGGGMELERAPNDDELD